MEAWNEAQALGSKLRSLPSRWADESAVTDMLSQTRIGRFVSSIIVHAGRSGGGLALFDGSVQTMAFVEPEEALRNILKNLLVPWDRGSDTLYVWSPVTVSSWK